MVLADYIRALIERLGEAEPAALARLRATVGGRSALIVVDDEAAFVRFDGDRLQVDAVAPDATVPVDGIGETSRQTVLELLAGLCEVTEAILRDRLRLRGSTEGIIRMSQAIDILIDVAVRAPSLQETAAAYREDATRAPLARRRGRPAAQVDARRAERDLLRRLGLLSEP